MIILLGFICVSFFELSSVSSYPSTRYCSPLSPHSMQPLIEEVEEALHMMQKIPHPDIGSLETVNMSISEMNIWMPDLSNRTVKSLVQGELFKMHNMMNMELLKSRTEGSSEENSLGLIDLEYIDLRDMVEKYFDQLMKLFNRYHHLPLMMQSNLKKKKPLHTFSRKLRRNSTKFVWRRCSRIR